MPAESVSTRPQYGFSRTRGDDHGLAQLARRQHGVVARQQLLKLGMSEEAIEVRIRAGRLHPLHAGVYAVGHSAISRHGRWLAAVLVSGPVAVLSHLSAAALWGIRPNSRNRIDVTVPHRSRSSDAIYRHLSVLPADERTVVDGIPVTSAPRTIFDLAATSTIDQVGSAIRQAEYRRLYDRLSLVDMVERYPRRRGVRRVRAALARIETLPAGRARSPLEERFLPFLRRHGLPQPRLNAWIAVGEKRFQVDCHWPGTVQVVELDSWEAHGTRSAFREDRARDRELAVAGYAVTRISWAQIDDEPEAVARDLCTLLYKRS
jgi:predicted transcriptional regulator of viral defense system/very-short-patch-repair endonuclease